MNLFTKLKQTHRLTVKQTYGYHRGKAGAGGLGKMWRDKSGVWD